MHYVVDSCAASHCRVFLCIDLVYTAFFSSKIKSRRRFSSQSSERSGAYDSCHRKCRRLVPDLTFLFQRGSGSEEESRTERIGARFFLRSSKEYVLQDGVAAIGIRRCKAYMIVRSSSGENLVLSSFRLPDEIKDKIQNISERDQLTRLLCEKIACRYVDKALDVRYASVDGLIFTTHRLYQFGSLRDYIHACPPRKPYFEKYCMPFKPLVRYPRSLPHTQ